MDLTLSPPHRIVLLIDLHPLLQNPNPNPYLARLLASVRKILTFPPLSSSLFASRLFVSSLSPIFSASLLHSKSPLLLSFHLPLQTLAALSQTLRTLQTLNLPLAGPTPPPPPPRPPLLAKFLLQLLHDYSWDPDAAGSASGIDIPQTLTFRSNLVLLFSPVCLDFDRRVFGPVNQKFVARDIQFSWVDVNFDFGGECEIGFFERGIRELGWGFCSADEIVLGSALVPFGLIFPTIGCPLRMGFDSNFKKGRAELFLGITDVSGKPLECKSCDLEAIELKLAKEKLINCDGGAMKIRVKDVWGKDEEANVVEKSSGLLLLRPIGGDSRKERGDCKRDFIADRVLQLLCREKGELEEGKPIWQLLLAFLYRRNCCASVSISSTDGSSLDGILKPFTVNYALLSFVEKINLNSCHLVGVSGTTDGRRKRNKMQKKLLHGVTWSSFYEEVFRQDDGGSQEMELEEIYFAVETNQSKKLRFLKCWMRQVKKSSDCCQSKQIELKEPQSVDEEVKERLEDSHASVSLTAAHCSGLVNHEASPFSCLEDVEAFLTSISQKIENGLCSKEVELSSLAGRLVIWSIDAVYVKVESNSSNESEVFSEVSRLLLMKPKDLTLKYKNSNSATNYSTEKIIRVHELQILFRMEILGSKIAECFEENVKHKMVKEICSLLQNIEFYLQGDFLCGESLLEFAGRTIMSRYARTLGDIIRKIYDKMEFFSFDCDDMEASDPVPGSNSEEPIRDCSGNNDSPRNNAFELTAAHLKENNGKDQLTLADNEHEERLMKAQKTRDRARRFSSFTSWVPDLHRVWALKQPKVEKPVLDSVLKIQSKRMKRKKTKYEMVCETPMLRKKHTHSQEDESSGSDSVCPDTGTCRLRSKALFQHEGDTGSDMIV